MESLISSDSREMVRSNFMLRRTLKVPRFIWNNESDPTDDIVEVVVETGDK